ncbi:hypothetical protein PARPLA_01542 [Rhodobacteraceae bacterium THAF1]|uniref:DUF6634 family protein n=1 Tax=Palleronia sp. THAF1 TaxID=2587842 RepID=UPI000F3EBCE2|nr:DUF6634 family protein [Palleronia sp. THAF1]QFU07550.1 hypothetical protein FIU81_02545 [Palleronia sp. THAF1]VDC22897.1 hypothetical protein PARPLA_01542 [Rhodobacteraceae bacterium THAF1]
MDPNDTDAAYIRRFRDVAPLDSRSWQNSGHVDAEDIDEDLREVLLAFAPFLKFTERDGRWIILAPQWIKAHHVATQAILERMYLRSLEMAAKGPDESMLDNAPHLDKWLPVRDSFGEHASLVGYVEEHPLLSPRWITTSRLAGIDPGGKWARTMSRWYRLRNVSSPDELTQELGSRIDGISGAALFLHEALVLTRRAQADEGL